MAGACYSPLHHPPVLHIQSLPPTAQLDFEEFLLTRTTWEHYLLSQIQFLVPSEDLIYHLSSPDLIAALDGSYNEQNTTGSYAWILSQLDGTRLIRCSGNVTAHRGSSFCSEAYGILSLYLLLQLLTEYFTFRPNLTTIYSDSKSAVDVLNTWDGWKPR